MASAGLPRDGKPERPNQRGRPYRVHPSAGNSRERQTFTIRRGAASTLGELAAASNTVSPRRRPFVSSGADNGKSCLFFEHGQRFDVPSRPGCEENRRGTGEKSLEILQRRLERVSWDLRSDDFPSGVLGSASRAQQPHLDKSRLRQTPKTNHREEIRCLLEKFVKPRLANEFPLEKWAEIRASVPYKDSNDMALDYEFEWSPQTGLPRQSAATRVEVLHPLFVGPASAAVDRLCVAHITDIHADIRDDVFEDLAHNLAPPDRWAPDISEVGPTDEKDDRLLGGWEQKTRPTEPLLPKQRWKAFNNKNRRFEEIYKKAKEGCDVLLLTGDLITDSGSL